MKHPPVIDPDAIDDLIDQWRGGGGQGMDLHEWLGWTFEEYARWMEAGTLPNHS